MKTILLGLLLVLFIATNTKVFADDTPPTEYRFSETEYADLKAYMNYARLTLEETLNSAQNMGGARLYVRLLSGVRSSLAETQKGVASGDRSQEVLLFRAVLERALSINAIYMAGGNPTEAQVAASSVVLLGSIYAALNYYKTDDSARVSTSLVPAPDWIAFTRDQIPVLLRVIDLAPTVEAQTQLTLLALNWTAQTLNRSVHRRNSATLIVRLGDASGALERKERPPSEAQNLLKDVQRELAAQTTSAIGTESPVSFGSANLPGVQQKNFETRTSIFPLIESKELSQSGSRKSCSEEGASHLFFASAGLGGGYLYGQNENGSSGFAQLSGLAHYLYMPTNGSASPLATSADFRGDIATPISRPIYHVRVDASASSYGGFWAMLEFNQYLKFREQIAAFGLAIVVPAKIDEQSYTLVRVTGGFLAYGEGPGIKGETTAPGTTAFIGNAQLLFRLAKALLVFDYNFVAPGARAGEFVRHAAHAGASIPMNILTPNDGLRLDLDYTHYKGKLVEGKSFGIARVGTAYEMRF